MDKYETFRNYLLKRVGFDFSENDQSLTTYIMSLHILAKNNRYLGVRKAIKYSSYQDTVFIEDADKVDDSGYIRRKKEGKYISMVNTTEKKYKIYFPLNMGEIREKYIKIEDSDIIEHNDKQEVILIPENPVLGKVYELIDNVFVPVNFGIIDYLLYEIKAKKNKTFTKNSSLSITSKQPIITASDLSSFSFCPASYSIIKTFEIKTENQAIKSGVDLHEEIKLSNWLKKEVSRDESDEEYNARPYFPYDTDENTRLFLNDIKGSTLLFSGHNNNDIKYFINQKGNYCGQPDYIFENQQKSHFVVEEKFRIDPSSDKKHEQKVNRNKEVTFYKNHQIQLISYLYGIQNSQYNIEYGYLVYWYYKYDYTIEMYYITKVTAIKLTKNESNLSSLSGIFEKVSKFNHTQKLAFNNEQISLSKCGNCSVNRYCGHKTGRYELLELPYNDNFQVLFPATYPSEISQKSDQYIPNTNEEKIQLEKSLLNDLQW